MSQRTRKPRSQRKLSSQHRAVTQIIVTELAASLSVRIENRVHRVRVLNTQNPRQISRRVTNPQSRPTSHSLQTTIIDEQTFLVQITVNHSGVELPPRNVLHHLLPPAQKLRRDLTRLRDVIQLRQHASANFLRLKNRKTRSLNQFMLERVNRGDRTPNLPCKLPALLSFELLQIEHVPNQVVVHESAQLPLNHSPRDRRHGERQRCACRRGERVECALFGLELHTRVDVAGAGDAPPFAFGVHDERGVEVSRVFRETSRLHGGKPGDGGCCDSGEVEGTAFHPHNVTWL